MVGAFKSIEPLVTQHDEWNRDVKNRRDPVAHRIPLYLPHAILTPEESRRYGELRQQHIEEVAARNFVASSAAFEAMRRIGKFYPYFFHHPEEAPIPIYPTIPTDMAHVVKISKALETALAS